MNTADAFAEAQRLNRLLDAGIEAIRTQAVALAEAENVYRKARAEAWMRVPKDGSKEWTAGRREAQVDADTADLRQARDIAEGVQRAAIEAVRARRQQLSVLQSFVAAERSEMELAR
jgi:hypothetical protein